jgi:hypothetical protein
MYKSNPRTTILISWISNTCQHIFLFIKILKWHKHPLIYELNYLILRTPRFFYRATKIKFTEKPSLSDSFFFKCKKLILLCIFSIKIQKKL